MLRPGDTAILDNLNVHKVVGVREAIEVVGARIRYLPAYSPELNSMEQTFAKLKALLRSAAAHTVPDLRVEIHKAFVRFTLDECRNSIAAAGYDYDKAVATWSKMALGASLASIAAVWQNRDALHSSPTWGSLPNDA